MAVKLSKKQAASFGLAKKKSKYRAEPTVVHGIKFPSKKEARRYGELLLLQAAGKISGLMLQVDFPLHAPRPGACLPVLIGHYRADFTYTEDGQRIVEEVKGFWTALAKWKVKHFEAEYGTKVRIT